MRRAPAVLFLATTIVVTLAGTAVPAGAETPAEVRHSSGLVLVGPLDENPAPMPEDLAQAHHDAVRYAEENAATVGYPWIDRKNHKLVLSAAGAQGLAKLQAFQPRAALTAGVTSIRSVSASWKRLEGIKDEAISLGKAVPDASAIVMTEPDEEHNRVVITVDRMSDPLLNALAARYGTTDVAIRYSPKHEKGHDDGRDNDTSPFYGGALINAPAGTCSTGFPWYSGTTSYMVTAGHCAPNGGSVSTPAQSMGSVTASSRENRNPGVGTVYLTGQTTYRGDIALIQMSSGRASGSSIFRGGVGSSSSYAIDSMWSRAPQNGDQYCTGGRTTGEQCGWVVVNVRINYTNSNGEVLRNVSQGRKQGQCTMGGDSGGPTYTVLSNGNVVAKGIHSGTSGGGSDNWGGALDPCYERFTDIWDAYYGFPGQIREI
ncbi:S1 family peptidase [Dactylosporangium sp. AC04546]|uniref:S1 family peptidase n=1 Tax=Dactylosporangium sp. AC04546 TaxID=2862460 RepID=UPI001EE13AD7|nr:S1 family peptidase [Dactylosporangium sp. AC04546]WVK88452.1 S1 family peptidase [Dactylosporangium sp. AC04546]